MSKDLETIIKIQEKIIKANDTEIKEYKKISDWLMDKTVDLSIWNRQWQIENTKLYDYGKSLTRVLQEIGKKRKVRKQTERPLFQNRPMLTSSQNAYCNVFSKRAFRLDEMLTFFKLLLYVLTTKNHPPRL